MKNSKWIPQVGKAFEYGTHYSKAICLGIGLEYIFASTGSISDGDYEELLIDICSPFHPTTYEREVAIEEIKSYANVTRAVARSIYDAGYRKNKGDKNEI